MAQLDAQHVPLPDLAVACVAQPGQDVGATVWDEALLTGSIQVPAEVRDERIPTVLVVVDDDSGSMGCSGVQADGTPLTRVQAVRDKSQQLLAAAAEAGIPYNYCRFGSQHQCHGQVPPDAVPGLLRCSWGTTLMALTNAALEAATQLTEGATKPLRIVFVLNTDGEAYDGEAAAATFRSGFEQLCARRPIAAARSFVFGIGPSHDHRTLGAVSVGEASYFNFPDGELSRMATDALQHVVPELTGGRQRVPVYVGAGRREEVVQVDDGVASLDGISVLHGETCIAVHGGQPVQLHFRAIEKGTPEYWDQLMNLIRRDALRLAAQSRACAMGAPDRERAKQLLEPVARLKDLLSQVPDDTTVARLRAEMKAALSAGRREDAARLRLELRAAQLKDRGVDRKVVVRDAIAMCSDAALALSNGRQLHADIERDMMEFLSVGGYQRWGDRRKQKLVSRQQEKANAEAVEVADASVLRLLDQGVPDCGPQSAEAETCWLTLCTNEQLATQGDVLCLAGYVEPGARRLAVVGVNSASVLHEAVLNGSIRVCPFPVSFLTVRELLRGGNQIERAPDGGPINAVFVTLPGDSDVSLAIARAYQPLCTSQMITSRWVFTEKAGEFRNGLMVGLQCPEGAGEAQRRTRRRAFDALRRIFGHHWVQSCAERYAGVRDHHLSTSHEIPSVLMALGDVMVANDERPPVAWWREVVFRVLRDSFGKWCKWEDNDPDDAVELAVQGLNADAETCERAACSLEGIVGTDADFAFGSTDSMDTDIQALESMLGALSFSEFKEEEEGDAQETGCPGAKPVKFKKPWAGMVRELLRLRSECPVRGAPTGDAHPAALDSCGPVQRLLVRAAIAQCRRELKLLLNTAAHIWDVSAVPSLRELLGFLTEEELFQWLRSRVGLALQLRDNARLRSELEEGTGSLDASVAQVLQRLNQSATDRSKAVYERKVRAEQLLKIKRLRVRYRRIALGLRETPDAWGCFIPLQIADMDHLARLSQWTEHNRGFKVEYAETPDGQMTGMAINTMLSRGSPWFMRHANAKEAIVRTWGGRGRVTRSGDVETELRLCAPEDGAFAIVAALNLHVCARRIMATDGNIDCATFCSRVAAECPARAFGAVPNMSARLVELWVSHRLSQRALFSRPVQECMEKLSLQLPAGDEARQVLAVACGPLHMWYSDPGKFLETPEFQVAAPTMDEFMAVARPADEEEAKLASAAFSKGLEDLSGLCKDIKRKRDAP